MRLFFKLQTHAPDNTTPRAVSNPPDHPIPLSSPSSADSSFFSRSRHLGAYTNVLKICRGRHAPPPQPLSIPSDAEVSPPSCSAGCLLLHSSSIPSIQQKGHAQSLPLFLNWLFSPLVPRLKLWLRQPRYWSSKVLFTKLDLSENPWY